MNIDRIFVDKSSANKGAFLSGNVENLNINNSKVIGCIGKVTGGVFFLTVL